MSNGDHYIPIVSRERRDELRMPLADSSDDAETEAMTWLSDRELRAMLTDLDRLEAERDALAALARRLRENCDTLLAERDALAARVRELEAVPVGEVLCFREEKLPDQRQLDRMVFVGKLADYVRSARAEAFAECERIVETELRLLADLDRLEAERDALAAEVRRLRGEPTNPGSIADAFKAIADAAGPIDAAAVLDCRDGAEELARDVAKARAEAFAECERIARDMQTAYEKSRDRCAAAGHEGALADHVGALSAERIADAIAARRREQT